MALPETKSATLPLMEGMRLEMVQAINASGPNSNYRLYTLIPRVLAESADNPMITMQKTLDTYQENRNKFLVLLNVIPAPLRNSLVLGTLAHDFYANRQLYEASYHGVYAAGIAVKGRNGAFLSIEEIDEMCSSITRYCAAWVAWERTKGDLSQMSNVERSDMDHAEAIDQQYRGAAEDGKPQFVGNPLMYQKASAYNDWLKKRADNTRTLDATRQVAQTQSPIYVGCSAKPIELRIVSHNPKSGLRSSNALLGLTLSCIKHRYPLLEPETIAMPILPTWTWDQLVMGEQLVTALASSMFYEGGLNVVQAGAHHGVDDPDARRHVFGERPFFADNAAETLEEHAMYRKMHENLLQLQPLFDGTDMAKLAELEEAQEALEDTRKRYQAALDAELKLIEQVEGCHARIQRRLALVRDVRRLLRARKERLAGGGNVVPRSPNMSSSPEGPSGT